MRKTFTAAEIEAARHKPNLSVDEAAVLAGINRGHLYAIWQKGDGPPRFKIGKRTLVPRDGLMQWLAQCAAKRP